MRSPKTCRKLSIAAFVLTSLLSYAPTSKADSGQLNVHVRAGATLPQLGFLGGVAVDYKIAGPLALELALDAGLFEGAPTVGPRGQTGRGTQGIFLATFGARLRFLEDLCGYASENGPIHGGFWVSPHLGLVVGDSTGGFSFDAEIGYELSISRPFSLGVFVRPIGVVGDRGLAGIFQFGLSGSFDVIPDDLDSRDSDGDGVRNPCDRCPRTPAGEEVDERGCVKLERVLVIDGIEFAFDSADILPQSARALDNARRKLEDNPDVEVEISGHTDNVGTDEYNSTLSTARARAVLQWMTARGISAARLRAHGYGASRPRAPNDSEEQRARNRRIEFRVID